MANSLRPIESIALAMLFAFVIACLLLSSRRPPDPDPSLCAGQIKSLLESSLKKAVREEKTCGVRFDGTRIYTLYSCSGVVSQDMFSSSLPEGVTLESDQPDILFTPDGKVYSTFNEVVIKLSNRSGQSFLVTVNCYNGAVQMQEMPNR